MNLQKLRGRSPEEWLLVAVGLFVVFLIFIGLPWIWWRVGQDKAWFFGECLKEHKEYECYAMWRGGRR